MFISSLFQCSHRACNVSVEFTPSQPHTPLTAGIEVNSEGWMVEPKLEVSYKLGSGKLVQDRMWFRRVWPGSVGVVPASVVCAGENKYSCCWWIECMYLVIYCCALLL